MSTITQSDIGDITGMDDNMAWTFYTQDIRESGDGEGIVTTKQVRKYPVAGVLTVPLDPGPAVVIAPNQKHYPFTVPEEDSELWPLIQAAVTIPPGTRHQELVDAVEAWLEMNADAWDSIPGKPAFVAAGATAADARAAIGIDLTDLDEWEWFANFAAFPTTGVTDVVYGARDTEFIYRWNGSAYIQIGGSGTGDMTKAVYDPTNIAASPFARANHTGTQSADTIVDGSTNHVFTAADDTKLTGIATGATANDTDANLKNRANHTGTQAESTITNLVSDLAAKEATANKGQPNGYAGLDGGGKVPITQLPSSIMEYQGTWNATTNSPTLADGSGSVGDVYRVSTGGTRNLGSGNITFDVGDYVILNASSVWEKSDTTDAVGSVAGLTGNPSASALRTALSLVVGTDVQAFNTLLAAIAGLTVVNDNVLQVKSGTIAQRTPAQLKTDLVLGNVDNTSDITKNLVVANAQTASYTLVLGDATKAVEMNVASANNVTVPPNSSVAFPIGTVIEIHQYGAGQTTIVAGAGVTIRSPGGKLKLAVQYASAALRKRATDEWVLEGDIAA